MGPEPRRQTPDVEGLKGKVFYVWFDAPIEYIGATKEWADSAPLSNSRNWKSWWQGDDAQANVRYVEFMGKDNVPFHTVGFPVTMLGSGEKWKLVDQIKGFNWLNYYGGKFSTSQKRGIFMDTALEILPAGLLALVLDRERAGERRLLVHLAAFRRHREQGSRRRARQLRQSHAEVHREAIRPGNPGGGVPGPKEARLAEELERRFGIYSVLFEEMQLRKAAAELRAIWVLGNEYLAEAAPWTSMRTDKDAAAAMRARRRSI